MDTLGYIFEISKGEIHRGYTYDDLHFLYDILHGCSTKYKIYSKLQKEGSPISYKNIHRRIEKLLQNKLIEEITVYGGYKHGARNFGLTERGMAFLITETGIPNQLPELVSMYKNSLLFETFVFNYFELKTIKSATYTFLRLLQNYLEECCILVLSQLEGLAHARSVEYHPVSKPDDIGSSPDLMKLRLYLNWHIHSFLIKICMIKDESADWRAYALRPPKLRVPAEDKIRCEANDKEMTLQLLSADRKYMNAIKKLQKDFSEGYNRLTGLERS